MAVLEPGVFAPSPRGYDGNVVNEALPQFVFAVGGFLV